MTLTRRDALRLAAAAAATPLMPRTSGALTAAAPAAGAGRFFTGAEMALLDELTEMIVPVDEHSGGARAAGVAAYIDDRLAQYDPAIPLLKRARDKWKGGLAAVEARASAAFGKPFLQCSPEERTTILGRMAAREKEIPADEPPETVRTQDEGPDAVSEIFFVELKAWTTRGYYTSKIGLHDELEYKGNTLLMEFVGADPATLPPISSFQTPTAPSKEEP